MRVLLPVDTDAERAIAAAKVVSSLPNAAEAVQVTILNVKKEVDMADVEGTFQSEDWYDENEYPSSVEEAADIFETEGIAYEKRREHADPAETIIDIANEIDADRIVMAGRKRTPVGKVLFGSVTQSVLLNGDIPVTVITS